MMLVRTSDQDGQDQAGGRQGDGHQIFFPKYKKLQQSFTLKKILAGHPPKLWREWWNASTQRPAAAAAVRWPVADLAPDLDAQSRWSPRRTSALTLAGIFLGLFADGTQTCHYFELWILGIQFVVSVPSARCEGSTCHLTPKQCSVSSRRLPTFVSRLKCGGSDASCFCAAEFHSVNQDTDRRCVGNIEGGLPAVAFFTFNF